MAGTGSVVVLGVAGSLEGRGASAPLVLGDGAVVVEFEAVDAPEGALVCAPPLLPTVTPGATSVVDDVAPDDAVEAPAGDVASVLPPAVDVDVPDDADVDVVEPADVVAPALVVPGSVDPVEEPVPVDDTPDAGDDELDASALATPGEVTTITPIPNAAANAPTRPT